MKSLLSLLLILVPLIVGASDNTYFPEGSVSDFAQQWYGQHLAVMNEPVLKTPPGDLDYFALRLLYLPTWGRPIAVRVEKKAGLTHRRAVMLSGDGEYDPGAIKRDKTAALTAAQLEKLQLGLKNAGLFGLSARDDVLGTDGNQLIIELVQGGRYSVFCRWTPEYETEKRGLTGVYQFAVELFQEAGLWKKQ